MNLHCYFGIYELYDRNNCLSEITHQQTDTSAGHPLRLTHKQLRTRVTRITRITQRRCCELRTESLVFPLFHPTAPTFGQKNIPRENHHPRTPPTPHAPAELCTRHALHARHVMRHSCESHSRWCFRCYTQQLRYFAKNNTSETTHRRRTTLTTHTHIELYMHVMHVTHDSHDSSRAMVASRTSACVPVLSLHSSDAVPHASLQLD